MLMQPMDLLVRPRCAELTEAAEVAKPGRRLIAAGSVIVALATAAGCGTSARSAPVPATSVTAPDSANARPFASISSSRSPAANEPPGLAAAHRALALTAAHREANQIAVGRNGQQVVGWPSTISAVTASVGLGTVTDSNTGHTCESGKIISVQLVGDFDTVISGPTPTVGTSGSPDTTVREVDLSVDAATGLTCAVSVRIETVPPSPGAGILYSR